MPGTGAPNPYIAAGQAALDIYGGVTGQHAAQRAAEQQQRAAQRGIDYRQAIQSGISGQYNPYQQLGYGALMPLAALAGQRAAPVQAPQGHSFLASSPAYGPTYQGQGGGGMPLSQVGSGGQTPDWSFLQHATQQTQQQLLQMSGAQPGPQDASGIRNTTTGGRDGNLVVQGPAETAYVNQWLAANPGKNFGDADLHGYRNEQTAQTLGFSPAEFTALAPHEQKALMQGGLAAFTVQEHHRKGK